MNVIITDKDIVEGANNKQPFFEGGHQILSSPFRLTT